MSRTATRRAAINVLLSCAVTLPVATAAAREIAASRPSLQALFDHWRRAEAAFLALPSAEDEDGERYLAAETAMIDAIEPIVEAPVRSLADVLVKLLTIDEIEGCTRHVEEGRGGAQERIVVGMIRDLRALGAGQVKP